MAAAEVQETVDLVFDLQGEQLPADHRHALFRAVSRVLPWLDEEPHAGIHAIRAARTDYGVALLPRRAKLMLRLPLRRVAAARMLEGGRIDVNGNLLAIGVSHIRPLSAAATLYADCVTTGSDDESNFGADIARQLDELTVPCRFICGRRRTLRADGQEISGYAVALHGVAPDRSLLLQRVGLGTGRKLGCGIFVQHKAITGLE